MQRYGNQDQQGFILIIVLLFMQICLLLSLYALESNRLEMQLARDYLMKYLKAA